MPLRRAKPMTFQPHTVCDAIDGTNGPTGGMVALTNLIPAPSTAFIFVPRPASVSKTTFGSFSTPGFISAGLTVGDVFYGIIASALHAGHDQPFAYNIQTNTFLTVGGITNGNTPVSPASTGNWTPPIIAQVGNRIVVCHPGFPGGTVKFGWFDVSSYSQSLTGDTTLGSPVITGNPLYLGVQPGMTISGTGIPANTTVISAAPFVLVTTGVTHTNTTLDGLLNTTGVAVGQPVVGAGIPIGTTVAAIVSPVEVTLSQAATASATITVTFSGATLTLSANASATNNGVALAVAGGTKAAPLWGAGDTNLNNLPSSPVGVAQFNGRAYYALGLDGIVFSDSGFPCQVSNNPNVQALLTNDGLPVTAIGPLPLNTTSGGIVQSLIAFEGTAKMQQITGDPVTSNLSMNALSVPTGTDAPLSIVPLTAGLSFVSPEGLRIISFAGQVSDPIGQSGTGVAVPFIYSLYPSRLCAAANADVLRISTINGATVNTPTQEYWYDLTRKIWTGPHSFPASIIQPWRNTFVLSAFGVDAKLWQSDVYPTGSNIYVENGAQVGCFYQTMMLPDNAEMAENTIVESALALSLPESAVAMIGCLSDDGQILDSVQVTGSGGSGSIWGQFNWGAAFWGGTLSTLFQRRISWEWPLVFKQMSITASFNAGAGIAIGNLYLKYQTLGYMLERVP